MTDVSHIRNLAIVAHIDHGKTTLIDSVFRATRTFRDNQEVAERLMDNNVLERERGITIRAKHCTVDWNDYLINIIDTPGHADFSGEVERVLSMVDSVLLLVDANEGPMPQTRYVLMRALRLGLRPIVVINKVDRPNARPDYALNKTFDLFIELGATDEQAHFPVLYGSGLDGWFVHEIWTKTKRDGMDPLFETMIDEVPPPPVDEDGPFLMQVSLRSAGATISARSVVDGYCAAVWKKARNSPGSSRTGKIRLHQASPAGSWPSTSREKGVHLVGNARPAAGRSRRNHRRRYRLAGRSRLKSASAILSPQTKIPAKPCRRSKSNSRPSRCFSWSTTARSRARRHGDHAPPTQGSARTRTAGQCRPAHGGYRSPDGVKVSGRGELHLAILIEEMRREGLEFCISRPEVITRRDDNGKRSRTDRAVDYRCPRGIPGRHYREAGPAQRRPDRRRKRRHQRDSHSNSRSLPAA